MRTIGNFMFKFYKSQICSSYEFDTIDMSQFQIKQIWFFNYSITSPKTLDLSLNLLLRIKISYTYKTNRQC